MLDLSSLPPDLREAAAQSWARLDGALDARARERIEAACADAQVRRDLTRVLAASEYVARIAESQSEWFAGFVADRGGARPPDADLIGAALDGATDLDDLKRALRRVRARQMVHAIWREALALADFDETVATVTRLAEQCIDAALAKLYRWTVERDGTPLGVESGKPQRLVAFALGKLGAAELNLSSDVDLVLAYEESGSTDRAAAGREAPSNQQFFVRLVQRLVQAIDDVTGDGFVFRVDLRLRPYGESGAVVLPFAAMELYFEAQGRDWERYAWIRARPCAGDREAGARFIATLTPFVFRRYLDFGAVQTLRELKSRIDAERRHASVRDDVKLGPGGIREVEFVVQLQQLIWAGRDPTIGGTRMRPLLARLAERKLLEPQRAAALADAYVFLRNTEHKLQAIRDEQTQRLPTDSVDRARVAMMMGFPTYDAFLATLDAHRATVARAFEATIGGSVDADDSAVSRFAAIWNLGEPGAIAAALATEGFGDVDSIRRAIERFVASAGQPRVGGEARRRFEALVPRLLAEVSRRPNGDETLNRIAPLVEAVMRRSSYFALLLENPHALARLVELCASSRWIAEELARHPMLLDELLDPALLYTVADRLALEADLARRLARIDGLEREIDALRDFKESHQFRVAACELSGILPLMKISDYLTFLAEVILAAALEIAWRSTAEPGSAVAASRPFAIVGYGKLGGLELGPGSDLDLVFLHDLPPDNERFLSRLIRRLMHVLTARTQSGALYEIDIRLRPSGRRGTMVSSLAGFERYQKEEAWVWEQQALVRARFVAGDLRIGAEFERIRRDVICRPRENSKLRREVVEMRERIEDAAEGGVDLKRERGGIVDIEFMVQYLALSKAAEHPALADWTDNVRILDTAAREGLLSADVANGLKDAYLALRTESHRAALDLPDDVRARDVLDRHQSFVRGQWQRLFAAEN